jgi:DnaK suppressor protein
MTGTEALARQLQARLAELTGQVDSLEAERGATLPPGFAEQAQALETQDALEGIEVAHLGEIAGIRVALARIAAGQHGICAHCGASIPAARLAALPMATRCIACAD